MSFTIISYGKVRCWRSRKNLDRILSPRRMPAPQWIENGANAVVEAVRYVKHTAIPFLLTARA